MIKSDDVIPSLKDVLTPALTKAFQNVIERAKQTRTAIAVWKDGKVVRVPYDQIDRFLAEKHL